MTRKSPSRNIEAEVLVASRRRCCICFGLHRDVEVKAGQVAHLDHDHSNNHPDNLAFLCLEHHADYDSRTRQTKGLTITEVKAYRQELHEGIVPLLEGREHKEPRAAAGVDVFASAMLEEQRALILELLTERGVASNISELATRAGTSHPTVVRQLNELARQGVVRIDRPKASSRKMYSLVASLENRLIDTFIATLGEPVTLDNRYVRYARDRMIDAYLETASGATFIIEILVARERLDGKTVRRRIGNLDLARRHFQGETPTGVLVIGITPAVEQTEQYLKVFENEGVRIQFVELARVDVTGE